MHLGRIETRVEDLEIKPGDIVRLLQPFSSCFVEYAFGLVVGVVTDGFRSKNHQSPQTQTISTKASARSRWVSSLSI